MIICNYDKGKTGILKTILEVFITLMLLTFQVPFNRLNISNYNKISL